MQYLFDCHDVRVASQVGLLEADHIEALINPQLERCVDLGDAWRGSGPKATCVVAANTQAESQTACWRVGRFRHRGGGPAGLEEQQRGHRAWGQQALGCPLSWSQDPSQGRRVRHLWQR